MFAYCNNNPIINSDPTGMLLQKDAGGGYFGGYNGGGGGGLALADPASGHIVRPATPTSIPLFIPYIPSTTTYDIDILRSETIAIRNRLCVQKKAKAKAEALAITETRTNLPQYYIAEIIEGNVAPLMPLSYRDAQLWVAVGGNLLCVNHAAAIAIVKFYPSAKWDGRHGCPDSGYLNHYHLSSAHGNHIWYWG